MADTHTPVQKTESAERRLRLVTGELEGRPERQQVQKTESAERRLRHHGGHCRLGNRRTGVQKTESAERRLRLDNARNRVVVWYGRQVQKTESAERRLRLSDVLTDGQGLACPKDRISRKAVETRQRP